MVATIPDSVDEGFNFLAWLGKITMKIRNVVLRPNNLPIKKTKSKSLKGKIVSRIIVDSNKTNFLRLLNHWWKNWLKNLTIQIKSSPKSNLVSNKS